MSSHSLWNWLEHNKLEIPRMQRDYAQGRIGRHVLRCRFLKSLKEALEPDSGPVSLDFVYGTVGNNDSVIFPLDGQQRLTTLWLLHWYLAMRTGALADGGMRERLKRFSYETRETSCTFCERLVEEGESIREKMDMYKSLETAVHCQTWFSPSFETDPTVTGMLRMLVGTKNQHKDGIDLWFKDATEDELWRYWERLTSKSCPITFFYQDLGALSDPDGLYIKMNARGKPLTPFENFKAELVEDVGTHTQGLEEGDRLRIEVAQKLDNAWTDVFWTVPKEEAGPKGEVPASYDDRYLAFFKRLAFNALVTARKDTGDAFVVRDDGDFEEKTGRLTRFGFESLDDYKDLLKNHKRGYFDVLDQLSILKKQECTFDDIVQNQKCAPEWFVAAEWVKSFRFVPDDSSFKCDTKGIQDGITQPGRAWFLALCRFLEKVPLPSTDTDWEREFTEWQEKLRTWLRVVANIIENAGIKTVDSMLGTMRLLDELSDHAEDILSFLSKGPILQSDALKKQREEEIEKAGYLVDPQRTEEQKKFLKSVEAHPCCRGAVRWLYRDGKGQVDWDSFAKKAERLRSLFPNDEGWSRNGAYAELVRHWTEDGIKQGKYKNIDFSRAAETWKESVFRVMCDGDEVLRTGLDAFLRGQQSPEPVGMVLCLVRGLERIEEKDCWPGENKDGFPGWRILTDWHVGRGKGEERDYEAVLTDYKVRTDAPDKLFVDLSSTPEEAEQEVDRYYKYKKEVTEKGKKNDRQEQSGTHDVNTPPLTERAPKTSEDPHVDTGTCVDNVVITLDPPDSKEFKEKLLKTKKARRILHYANGETKEEDWHAGLFKESSNLWANIRSTAVYRTAAKKGIVKISYYV